MSAILGTNVSAPIVPQTTDDTFPTHDAQYGKGGYRSVADIAARDAIPVARRSAGMSVVVQDDREYILGVGLTNDDWEGQPTPAELRDRATQTGTQPASTLTETDTLKVYTGDERTGLARLRARLRSQAFGAWAFYAADRFGRVAGGWDPTGLLRSGRARLGKLDIDTSIKINGSRFRSLLGLDAAWATMDRIGNISALVRRSDGAMLVGKLIAKTLQITGTFSVDAPTFGAATVTRKMTMFGSRFRSLYAVNAVWGAIDRFGNLAVRVRRDGVLEAGRMEAASGRISAFSADTLNGASVNALLNGSAAPLSFVATIEAVIFYGQSLSLGELGTPPLTTTAVGNALKWANSSYAAFAPLVEPVTTVEGSAQETPSGGCAQALLQLIQSDYGLVSGAAGHAFQPFFFNPGLGGAAISTLNKGTAPYTRLLTQLQTARDLAKAQGKTFRVRAIHWMQGQGDYVSGTTAADYKTLLKQLRIDLDNDIRALIPDNPTIAIILSQPASHQRYAYQQQQNVYPAAIYAKDANIAVAQYELAATEPYFTLACPEYIGDYQTDLVHGLNTTYKLIGGYHGVAHERIMPRGADIKSTFIRVTDVKAQGKIIELECAVPRPPLVIDNALTTLVDGSGFTLRDANGNDVGTLATTVIEPTKLQIVSPVDIATGFELRYAIDMGFNHTGRVDGPRGNVRDSAGTFTFDPGGISRALHNPFPIWRNVF